MSQLKDEIQKTVRQMTDVDNKLKDQIAMTVTAEGLRIELMESERGTFFPSAAAEPGSDGKDILVKLAQELGKLPNTIPIEATPTPNHSVPIRTTRIAELSTDQREFGPARDGRQRPAPKSDHAGARVCGSTAAQSGGSGRRRQPPYLTPSFNTCPSRKTTIRRKMPLARTGAKPATTPAGAKPAAPAAPPGCAPGGEKVALIRPGPFSCHPH